MEEREGEGELKEACTVEWKVLVGIPDRQSRSPVGLRLFWYQGTSARAWRAYSSSSDS